MEFSKSLISQIIVFMTPTSDISVILIIISLKLLKIKQSKIINHKLLQKKLIILNSKNNHKHIQDKITCGYYIHIFTSFKIALSKKFKTHVFD